MVFKQSNRRLFLNFVFFIECFAVNCTYNPPAANMSDDAWQMDQEHQLNSADDSEWQYTQNLSDSDLISDESLQAGGDTYASTGELLTFSPCNSSP